MIHIPETISIETCWKFCNDISNKCVPISRHPLTLHISLYDIGMYSVNYAEKWLLVPGRHYRNYVYSSCPTIYHTGAGVSRPYTEQVSKEYAGDVTGILGESISILALRQAFSIDPYKVVHLRPIKRNIKCPDYIIYEISRELENNFKNAFKIAHGLSQYPANLHIPRRIPLESKGSVTGNLKSAIYNAIKQLDKFWYNDTSNVPLSDRWGLISFTSLAHAPPRLSFVFVVPRSLEML